MKKIIPLIFIIMSQANANCTPKDLTDPEYLKSVGKENLVELFNTPRDQDGVGWCGAFATSDSLSFAVGEAVSPIDVSIDYYARNNRQGEKLQSLSGVGVLNATDLAKGAGYCPESVIPSNQTSSSNLGQAAILKLIESFQKIHDDYVAKGKPADYCVNCIVDYETIIKPTLPGATSDAILEVLQKNQSDSLTAFKDLLNKLCEGRRVVVKTNTNLIFKNSSVERMIPNAIDKALDNNSMPNFVMSTLYFANPALFPLGHGEHALMAVARRMGSNGKCEYQIRNSWGRGCMYYLPKFAANCDPAKGAFWMDEDDLQAGVSSMVVVDDVKRQKPVEQQELPVLNNGPEENNILEINNNNNNNNNNNTTNNNSNDNTISKPSFEEQVNTFVTKASETASKVASEVSKKAKIVAGEVTVKTRKIALELAEKAKKLAAEIAKRARAIWKSLSNEFKY